MSTIKLKCTDTNGNSIFVVDQLSGVYGTNTQPSSNSTTGGLVLYGGLSISNTTNSNSYTQGGGLTVAGGTSIYGDTYIGGTIYCNNIGTQQASGLFQTISLSSTKDSTNFSTGAMISSGGITVKTTTNSTNSTNGGALTIAGGAAIAKDLYVGGSLTVLGTQTNVVSQTLNIGDNLIVVNSAPNASRDAGLLVQRYQVENDSGSGDVVSDPPLLTGTLVSSSSSTAIFNTSLSSANDYYTNCYIKITSGLGINQVRKIISYTGSTRTATVNTQWTQTPQTGDTFSLFNRLYVGQFYQEATDQFVFGYSNSDPGNSATTIIDYTPVSQSAVTLNSTRDATGLGTGGTLTVLGGGSISKSLLVGTGLSSLYNSNTLGTLYTTGGNVGINQISPTFTLDVSGSIRSTSSAAFVSNSNTLGSLVTTGGNVGINLTTPSEKLEINGNLKINGITTGSSFTVNSNTGPFVSVEAFTTGNYSSKIPLLLQAYGGYIGIGTTNPVTKMHLASASDSEGLYISGARTGITPTFRFLSSDLTTRTIFGIAGSNGQLTGSSSQYDTVLRSENQAIHLSSNAGSSTVVYVGTSGNVGIGKTNPNFNLDVNTSVNAVLYTGANLSVTNISGGFVNIVSQSVGSLVVTTGITSTNSNTIGSLFTTGGNVGIGIVSPAYKLDINGAVNISSDLNVNGSISGSGSSSSTYAYLTLTATDEAVNATTGSLLTLGGVTIQAPDAATSSSNGGSLLTIGGAAIGKNLIVGNGILSNAGSNTIGNIVTSTSGYIGIGTGSPSVTVDYGTFGSTQIIGLQNQGSSGFSGFGATGGSVLYQAGTTSGSHVFYTNSSLGSSFGALGSETMRINGSGFVGIGTSSPSSNFHVESSVTSANKIVSTLSSSIGDSRYKLVTERGATTNNSGDIAVRVGLNYNYSNDNSFIRFHRGNGVTGGSMSFSVSTDSEAVRFDSTGNVGIGTTSPSTKLQVNGNVLASQPNSTASTYFAAQNSTGSLMGFEVFADTGVHFGLTGNTTGIFVSKSGGVSRVGIGNTNPAYQLDVSGSANFLGGVSVANTSNSTGLGTGGSLTVLGGASVSKDVYIGGNLYIAGQNTSTISGTTTIGSYSGTGVYTVTNIPIGKTMSNTSYKLVGNLNTTTNNTNVYAVTFKNLTTTTFDACILRLDSLFSSWTDSNLVLAWQVTP